MDTRRVTGKGGPGARPYSVRVGETGRARSFDFHRIFDERACRPYGFVHGPYFGA